MADNNPYVGPASFTGEDRKHFFGRDKDALELSYLLIARKAVLLYAQSGAGKTSLLKAKVIPDFNESDEIHVYPITRVSGPAKGANVYVTNALQGLGLIGETLTEAFDHPAVSRQSGAAEGEKKQPCLLIIDQFEEIFTFHQELRDQRRAFFEQLRDCLNTYPKLSLLLSMREDYLADMDSFSSYLPDRLRTRMRMERLDDKQAEEAIAQPAKVAGKPFDNGVARSLVDNLRRMQIKRKKDDATEDEPALGKYVEPVQLQIVCRQLWSKLPEGDASVSQKHVEELGNVDDALKTFYTDALNAVHEKMPMLTERTLRDWFNNKLITSSKTRGLVFQEDSETAGLPNEAVKILAEKYIIRADIRQGDSWYELTHDRLVEPILKDNLEWKETYRNPVAIALKLYGQNYFLTGSGLKDALEYKKRNPKELNEEEQRFLRRSEDEEAKKQKRLKRVIVACVVVFIVLLASTIWAFLQKSNAETATKSAVKSSESEVETKIYATDTLDFLKGVVPGEIKHMMETLIETLNTDKNQDSDNFTPQQIGILIELGRIFYNKWDRVNSWKYLKKANERFEKLSSAGRGHPEVLQLNGASQELAGDLCALHPTTIENAKKYYASALAEFEKYRKINEGGELDLARVHRKFAVLYLNSVEDDVEIVAAAAAVVNAATHVEAARRLIDAIDKNNEDAYSERAALNDLLAMKAMRESKFKEAQRLLEEAVKLDWEVIERLIKEERSFQSAKSALVAHLQHLGDTLRLSGSGDPSRFYAEAEIHAAEVLAVYPNRDETRFMLDLIRYGQSQAHSKSLEHSHPAEQIDMKASDLNHVFRQGFGRFRLGMKTAEVRRLLYGPDAAVWKYPDKFQRALEYLTGDVRYFWVSISKYPEFGDFYDLATDCPFDNFDIIVFLFHEDSLIRISYRLHVEKSPSPGCHDRHNLFPSLAKRYQIPLFGMPPQWRLQWDTKQVSIIGSTTPDTLKLDIVAPRARLD